MIKNKIVSALLDALYYLIAFILIQFAANAILTPLGASVTVVSAVSSVLTIALFMCMRWSPFSRTYIRRRPWGVLFWTVVLAFGTIIPSEWLQEQMGVDMSDAMKQMFEQILSSPVGYVVIGLLAPLAEEMVFRGAILSRLLQACDERWHWLPILLSALLFGAVHGNWAQFLHATLLGLLLGWMYYRTNSIVPGLALHWVNNSIVYVVYNLLPQAANGRLADLFGGNERAVWMSLIFSLCILLPSLFQLATRMKKY